MNYNCFRIFLIYKILEKILIKINKDTKQSILAFLESVYFYSGL